MKIWEKSKEDDENNDERKYEGSNKEKDDINDATAARKKAVERIFSLKMYKIPCKHLAVIERMSGNGWKNLKKRVKVCRWTEAQKIIYAKKLLRRSVKLFIREMRYFNAKIKEIFNQRIY